MAKTYGSWEEFEREEIRPCFRLGLQIENLEDLVFDGARYEEVDEDDFTDRFRDRY